MIPYYDLLYSRQLLGRHAMRVQASVGAFVAYFCKFCVLWMVVCALIFVVVVVFVILVTFL